MSTKMSSELVPIVNVPESSSSFPGLFVDSICASPWIELAANGNEMEANGREAWLTLTSQWRSRKTILCVNALTGKIANITPKVESGSWSVLCACQNTILAVCSSFNQPPVLMFGTACIDVIEGMKVDWLPIAKTSSPQSNELLRSISWETLELPERHPALECIILRNKVPMNLLPLGGDKPPLLVFPHGGPHVANDSAYSPLSAALCCLGFTVALVNYRGSTGFGEKANLDLVGHVGLHEVQDTQYVAEKLLETGTYDATRTCLTGGSHGGFTSAHLLGKYPNFYKACVMRNPVINIGAMVHTTDIPDWCFAEVGLDYNFDLSMKNMVHPDEYKVLFDASPMQYAKHVKTPTLVMLGNNDRRVPWTEGKRWYLALAKSSGVPMKCRVYSGEGHSLDGIEAEKAGWADISAWFLTHASQ